MAASRRRGSSGGRGSGGSSRGRGRGRAQCGGYPNQSSGDSNNSSSSRPQCQLCRKVGHTAKICWYRYEEDSTVEQRSAGFASSDGDNNWYTDSSATDHITGNLDKLTMHDPYVGNDQIHAANDSGMDITRIGNTIIPTSTRSLVLNNVLHVPSTHKNLISVHRFTLDNDTFIEFHPFFLLD
jgi:hypothetical protein